MKAPHPPTTDVRSSAAAYAKAPVAQALLVLPARHRQRERDYSAHTGEKIDEIRDLFRRYRLHHVGHGAVIAVPAVVLVFTERLGEIVLALVGDARETFSLPEKSGLWQLLQRY
jgi:hypothetical protein